MFPSNFLTKLARSKDLSPEQEEVFLLWFGNGKSDQEISGEIHVTVDAIRNRKTGIYKKFSIAGRGANKAWRLKNLLDLEARKQDIKADTPSSSDDLEVLVQEVKQKITANVTDRCGTMRVLSMTEPVDLERIYTNVNILEKISGKNRIDCQEVLLIGDRENFERWHMGEINQRIPVLEAFEKHQKLVVFGKPGGGKTTVMKYLAMSCLNGEFHGELVPIFVTLKDYAETKDSPSLQEYIFRELLQRKVTLDKLECLLEAGKALILLDGLDEVKKEDDRRVKQDIEQFSRDWLKNRFAITCRIAAKEYLFEKFTEVEVADFDDQQIDAFTNKWFRKKDETKGERMLNRLKNNKPVNELAKSPLLLTLLCLVFEARNDFPPNRSELYKEGLEVLMKTWDAKRNIEREQIYKHLSPQNKEDMLGQIAFNTFINSEYFFWQEDLQRQIKDYICNLPEASNDSDALCIDSEVVLRAIEHHHGLLVERARNIYSFSHLTFQEYFTAREIERNQQRELKMLMQNITDPRWEEVFLLTAEMLRQSDKFLQSMKEQIDEMFAKEEKLQSFLTWTKYKTDSILTKHKTTATRSFYAYSFFRGNVLEIAEGIAKKLTSMLDPAHLENIDDADDRVLDLSLNILIRRAKNRAKDLNLAKDLRSNIDLVLSFALDKDGLFRQAMQLLKKQLPYPNEDPSVCNQWWSNNAHEWINELRQVCIKHRNIGHDWQFTKEQIELIEKYYRSNLLLFECMHRSYASKQIREEIELTLLLPVIESKL